MLKIKTYKELLKEILESLSERSIPKILKDISLQLKNDISSLSNNQFNKSYQIDVFNFNLKLNFNAERYYSNIDLLKIINQPSIKVEIVVDIINNYDIDYVVAIVIHEIRHIYDIYTVNSENDMQSFVNSFFIKKLKIGNFTNFINLIYLSLEHELIARNNMIYPYVGLKDMSKEESIKIVKDSFIYESLKELSNFNHINFIRSMDLSELIQLTNFFIKDIAKDDKVCQNIDDINIFYKKWEDYFKNISVEWEVELNKEIDKIFEFKEHSYDENIIGGVNRLFLSIYREIFT